MGLSLLVNTQPTMLIPFRFTQSDGKAIGHHLFDLATLRQLAWHFTLDLSALHPLAVTDNIDVQTLINQGKDKVSARQRWKKPDQLIDTFQSLITALEQSGSTLPDPLLDWEDADYFTTGWFLCDLKDLLAMVSWAKMNGARRVRLDLM
jgi:hypothetical protein